MANELDYTFQKKSYLEYVYAERTVLWHRQMVMKNIGNQSQLIASIRKAINSTYMYYDTSL